MPERVLIQCGDNIENCIRVLSIAVAVRNSGREPVICVYSSTYSKFFEGTNLDTVNLYDYRSKNLALDAGYEIFDYTIEEAFPINILAQTISGVAFKREQESALFRRTFCAIDRIVKAKGISEIIGWNGFTGAVANAFRLYKEKAGLPGGFIERGLIAGGAIFDPLGTNGAASLAADDIDHSDLVDDVSLSAALSTFNVSTVEEAVSGIAQREKIVFVPLQVQNDSNIILFSPHVKTMRSLLFIANRIRNELGPEYRLVVRPHPEEDRRLALHLPEFDNMIVESGGTLEEWLRRATVTITINSTVGLEAAMRGCCVITLGSGIYCRQPFVISPRVEARGFQLNGLGTVVADWYRDAAAHHVSMLGYLTHLLDRHQVVPRHEDWMKGLTADNAIATPHERPDFGFDSASAQHRSIQVCGCERVKVTFDYRNVNIPFEYKLLEKAFRNRFGLQNFHFEAVESPTSGDIIIAGPNIGAESCSEYAVVLNEHLGIKVS